MNSPSKAHDGDSSHALSLVERLSSFQRYCYNRETDFFDLKNNVHCRKVYNTVSLTLGRSTIRVDELNSLAS